MIMKILCLNPVKQICSDKTASVKRTGLANIVTNIYGLGSMLAAVKIICHFVLFATSNSNKSMKPSKLKRHLDTFYSKYSDKPIYYFADMKKELIAAQKIKNALFPNQSNKNLTLTIFEISKLIAVTGYPQSA